MKSIKVLALGISVSVVLLGILSVVAIVDNNDLGILQTPSPAVEVTVSSGVPPVATLVPTPSPSPTPAPTPTPPSPAVVITGTNVGLATEDEIAVREQPSSDSPLVRTLAKYEQVSILGQVEGESWIVSSRNWSNKWYQLSDGYVYVAFIFVPESGEGSPFVSGNKWVEVDRTHQILYAYADGNLLFQTPISIGLPESPTPLGNFEVGIRVFDERMTDNATYDISQVLYSQYFIGRIYALHINWWAPADAFGEYGTGHGCVGLSLYASQWLWLFGFKGMKVKIYE